MTVRLSFVIPVRNDAVRLETCLRSIQAAHEAGDQPDIVVVDNGSVDASPDVARRLGARVVVLEHLKVSELRNRGARLASGDAVAFVDADNEITRGWVAAARENLTTDGVGATGALYQPPPAGTWVQRGYGLLRGVTRERAVTDWLGSGNLAVTRRAFEAIDGFDTTLEACEDVDFCHRLRAGGFRLLGDPRLGSIHHGDPKTLRDLYRSELWRGRDNLRVSLRSPIDWSSIPSAVLPVIDGLLLVAAAGALVLWFTGWVPGIWIASAALMLVLLGALMKVARALRREPAVGLADMAGLSITALVYDVARAAALVRQAPHRNAQVRAASTPAS